MFCLRNFIVVIHFLYDLHLLSMFTRRGLGGCVEIPENNKPNYIGVIIIFFFNFFIGLLVNAFMYVWYVCLYTYVFIYAFQFCVFLILHLLSFGLYMYMYISIYLSIININNCFFLCI